MIKLVAYLFDELQTDKVHRLSDADDADDKRDELAGGVDGVNACHRVELEGEFDGKDAPCYDAKDRGDE